MKLTVLVVGIICAAICSAFEPDNYNHIGLFPTDLVTHGIWFSYHTNVSAVEIQLPTELAGVPFKEALLFFARGDDQYLQIPVQPIPSERKFTVGFWMDGRSLQESELRVTFQQPKTLRGTQFHLCFRHFVRVEGTPHNAAVQQPGASRSGEHRIAAYTGGPFEVPEKRPSEAEAREHIVGVWTVADKSDGCWYPTLIIGQDGTLTGVLTNGTKVVLGSWEFSGHALRVTPTPARLKAARASGDRMNDWDWYPVVYADDHELVMTPGISMAGRWRYQR